MAKAEGWRQKWCLIYEREKTSLGGGNCVVEPKQIQRSRGASLCKYFNWKLTFLVAPQLWCFDSHFIIAIFESHISVSS